MGKPDVASASPKFTRTAKRNVPVLKGSLDNDPHLQFLKNPHATSILVIGIGFLVYCAFFSPPGFLRQPSATPEATTIENYRAGVLAGCICFLLFCMAQLKDGVFIRPHPAVWRVVTGCGVLYLCGLVFLLFQNADDARNFLKNLDPALGVPLPERSYAEDCRVYTPEEPIELFGYPLPFKNIIAALDDRFVWAHFIGWWGKTVLFRDVYICWASSILFEILELSLQHMLPNFAECWWDHIILDVFGANFIGIVLGGLTIKYFEMSTYDWTDSGWHNRKNPPKNILARGLSWFTPRFDELHWDWIDSWKRFAGVLMLFVLTQGSELTAFFLKFILWVPAEHDLNIVRLLLWWLMAAPATRELYLFSSEPNVKKIGHTLWLVIAALAVEIMICVKFGSNMFADVQPPPFLQTAWLVCIAILGGFCLVKMKQNMERRKQGLLQQAKQSGSNKQE